MRKGLLGKWKCDQLKHEMERKWVPENSKHSRWMQCAVLEGEGVKSHLSRGQLQAWEQSEQQTGDCRHRQVTLKPQHMLVGGRWSDSVWRNPQGELPVSHDSLAYLLSAKRRGVEGVPNWFCFCMMYSWNYPLQHIGNNIDNNVLEVSEAIMYLIFHVLEMYSNNIIMYMKQYLVMQRKA